MEFLVIFIVCTLSGVLTGLLGIGGGLIIVPAFLTVLPLLGVEFSIQQIVGISATCVFLNSALTVFHRRKEQFEPLKNIAGYAVAISLGTIVGSCLFSSAPKNIILFLYIGIALVSLYLMLFKSELKNTNPKLNSLIYPIFSLIGILSSAIGIGGAIFFSTTLNFFTAKNCKELLPTTTMLVLIHAFFAFASKFALGEVTIKIIPIALAASLIGTKIGVKICKHLPPKTINFLMAFVLVLALIRTIIELWL